ncbi:MAG: radical SAM protein [Deltaproteobacteria bacterium]|jgi:radical SAM protein with 4Fe4S-binding SPASM domain|nr:radical SAM protein [Deltaproteobacteria bacterium]
MDIFTTNLQSTFNTTDFAAPEARGIRIIKDICLAAHALKYDAFRDKSLQIISDLCATGGYIGEAYRAATSLPDERYNDRTGLLSKINTKLPPQKSLAVSLETISFCNIRCPLCSNAKQSGKNYYQHGKLMTFDVFKRIWDDISPFVSLLILVGQGETFMHPDIYKMLEYVKPTPVHIDTNGNAKIDAKRVVESSLQSLLFSVDGVDQRTYEKYRVGGDFEKCMDNMRKVVAAKREARRGPDIVWKYILFKHTEPYVQEFKQMAQQIGVNKIEFVPCVVDPKNTEELIREFMPVGLSPADTTVRYVDFANRTLGLNAESDSPYCHAGINNPHIRINGDINICCSSYDPVGNVLEGGFIKNWNSEEYTRQRKQALTNRYALPECRACSRRQNNLGRIFEGTVLEYPKPPEADPDHTLWMKDLKIEPDYLAYLEENGLTKDIEYFRARNVIRDVQPDPDPAIATVATAAPENLPARA